MLKLLAIIVLVFVGHIANASVFIEPYAGYVWGKSEAILSATPDTPVVQNLKGFGGGLRAGFYLGQSLFFAADGTYFDFKLDAEDPADKDLKGKQLLLGGVGGFHILGLRLWGGYYFKNEQEFEATLVTPYTETYTGTAWKAGLSFELFASVNLAFEYIHNDFKKYTGNAGVLTLNEAGLDKLEVNTYFVSLTLPLGRPGGPSGRR